MVKIEQVISGISEYLKVKLYPSLDSGNRMKVSSALYIANWNPMGVLSVLLAKFFPDVPADKAIDYAKTLKVLDDNGNVDVDLLLGLAKSHVEEFGELSVNLFGIEFDMDEKNITTLGEYIKAKPSKQT